MRNLLECCSYFSHRRDWEATRPSEAMLIGFRVTPSTTTYTGTSTKQTLHGSTVATKRDRRTIVADISALIWHAAVYGAWSRLCVYQEASIEHLQKLPVRSWLHPRLRWSLLIHPQICAMAKLVSGPDLEVCGLFCRTFPPPEKK